MSGEFIWHGRHATASSESGPVTGRQRSPSEAMHWYRVLS